MHLSVLCILLAVYQTVCSVEITRPSVSLNDSEMFIYRRPSMVPISVNGDMTEWDYLQIPTYVITLDESHYAHYRFLFDSQFFYIAAQVCSPINY